MTTPSAPGPIRSMPAWLVILICLVYVISPIDVLPDVVPLIGQLDDLAVLGVTGFEVARRVMACVRRTQSTTNSAER